MKKTENPYKGLIKLSQDLARSSAIQRGASFAEIVEPPPNIKVKWQGNILDSKYLYVDEYWLQGHARAARGHIVSATQNRAGGGGDASFASHNHDIDNDYTDTIIYTDTWKVGDKVMMIPIYGQDGITIEQFFVFGKARRLDGN